jgi:hypothetical protein
MFKPFLTRTFQSLPVVIALSSPLAFAQHGSVNGPVTGGSLNPASGATVVSREAFVQVRKECYEKMFLETFDPFLSTLTPHKNTVLSDSLAPNGRWVADGVRILPTSLNQSPLAVAARNQRGASEVFGISVWLDEVDSQIFTASITLYGKTTDIQREVFPSIRYEEVAMHDHDPITGAPLKPYRGLKNLTKRYEIAPADETRIPITDAQGKASNLMMNGKQFFECIESKL